MLPKSRFLFKHTVYLKVGAFLILIPLLLGLSLLQHKEVADAQIAFLYAGSCLGGWKNVDKVTGVPEVAGNPAVSYSEENSAVLDNKHTQIYCGGFSGTMPEQVERTKVSVRFSWQAEGEPVRQFTDAPQSVYEGVSEAATTTDGTGLGGVSNGISTSSPEGIQGDSQTEAELPEEVVPDEQSTPEEVETVSQPEEQVSWLDLFIATAWAQEAIELMPEVATDEPSLIVNELDTEGERIDEVTIATSSVAELVKESSTTTTATSSVTMASTSSHSVAAYLPLISIDPAARDGALFEVLFTMDNQEWYPLGYVSRISNDIQFELPLGLFTSVEDFSKLQISLRSLEQFDTVPRVYLDSMWLEVNYRSATDDPLPPPETIEGDVVMNKISTPDWSLVTLFRGIDITTVSNIMTALASSTGSTTSSETSGSSTLASTETVVSTSTVEETSTTSSAVVVATSSTMIVYESDLPLSVRQALRATPGVVIEIWYLERATDSWFRVADNSMVATIPYATLIDKKVFWIGVEQSSLWMFDVDSKGYSSRAVSPQDPVVIDFTSSASEPAQVGFNSVTMQLERIASSSPVGP